MFIILILILIVFFNIILNLFIFIFIFTNVNFQGNLWFQAQRFHHFNILYLIFLIIFYIIIYKFIWRVLKVILNLLIASHLHFFLFSTSLSYFTICKLQSSILILGNSFANKYIIMYFSIIFIFLLLKSSIFYKKKLILS